MLTYDTGPGPGLGALHLVGVGVGPLEIRQYEDREDFNLEKKQNIQTSTATFGDLGEQYLVGLKPSLKRLFSFSSYF